MLQVLVRNDCPSIGDAGAAALADALMTNSMLAPVCALAG